MCISKNIHFKNDNKYGAHLVHEHQSSRLEFKGGNKITKWGKAKTLSEPLYWLVNNHFLFSLQMLVMTMIDGGNAEFFRLHFICCPLKRRGRAMEERKMPEVSPGVFSIDPWTENSKKVPSRVPFYILSPATVSLSFTLSLSLPHIHTSLYGENVDV